MYALDVALQAKFQADNGAGGVRALATGGTHKIIAPEGAVAPYLTFQNVSSVHEYSFNTLTRIRCKYLLKAYADGLDWDTPQAIIERAKAILFDVSWSVSGYKVESRAASQFDTQEDVSGLPSAVTVGYVDIDLLPV